MIVLIGIPTEPPLEMVIQALQRLGAQFLLLNQRRFDTTCMRLEIRDGVACGRLRLNGDEHALEAVTAIYARPMDDAHLPELQHEPPASPRRARCRWLHELLMCWLDAADGRVVNRPSAMASNGSKPYQAQLIRRHGFDVPETLVTTDPEEVRDFAGAHGRLIYKSVGGTRSIVTEFSSEDADRLDCIRGCPTQFQEFVDGFNVRVHTVGNDVIATRADSTSTDYRYAGRQGGATDLSPFELPQPWPSRCVALSRALGLDFAGIDLKLSPDGRVFCFEVNPCPAYSYYELNTGQPIAAALARYLAFR